MADVEEKQALPEPLSDAYHRARRNLTFVCGILITWEYVGISIISEAGVAAATIPGGVTVAISHPEVAPVILLFLVLFFCLRTAIEWSQSDPARRLMAASKFDFYASMALAVTAALIFVIQHIFDKEVASILTPDLATHTMLAVGLYLVLSVIADWILTKFTAIEGQYPRAVLATILSYPLNPDFYFIFVFDVHAPELAEALIALPAVPIILLTIHVFIIRTSSRLREPTTQTNRTRRPPG